MYQIDKTLQIILRDIKDTIQKNQEEKKSLKPEHFVYSSGRLKRHNVKIQEMLESYLEGLQEMKRNRKSDFFKWIKFNLINYFILHNLLRNLVHNTNKRREISQNFYFSFPTIPNCR